VPTQKRIDRSTRIRKKLLVEMLASDTISITVEGDNLVVVLTKSAI